MQNSKTLSIHDLLTEKKDKIYKRDFFFDTKYHKRSLIWDVGPEYREVQLLLKIESSKNDVLITINTLSWSNEEQRLVDIDSSFYSKGPSYTDLLRRLNIEIR